MNFIIECLIMGSLVSINALPGHWWGDAMDDTNLWLVGGGLIT
jgi:hypothetical protein